MFGCALGGNFCAANAGFKQKLAHPTDSSNPKQKTTAPIFSIHNEGFHRC
jgi:hypothetical protein